MNQDKTIMKCATEGCNHVAPGVTNPEWLCPKCYEAAHPVENTVLTHAINALEKLREDPDKLLTIEPTTIHYFPYCTRAELAT